MVSSISSNTQMNNQIALNQIKNSAQNFNANVATPENNIITNKVNDAKKSPLTSIGLLIGSWFGLSKAADCFNRHTSGDYYESVIGKIGNFGDKVSENSVYKTVTGVFDKPLKYIKDYWAKNNETNTFLRILKNPAQREWKFAKCGPAHGYIDEISMDVIDVMRGFKNKYGDSVFKSAFGQTYEHFGDITDGAYKHAPEMEQALKKAIKYCKDNGLKDSSLLNDIPMFKTKFRLPKWLSRNATLSEAYNKLQMAKGLNNPMQKSTLGKLLPKWTCKVFEGLSNGTAGGKFAIAFQAGIFADAIYRTYKAPKGEKVSTFMETVTNDVTMYMMIPLYTQFFNRVGGLKYAGMTTAQKNAYQKTLQAFNDTARKGILSQAQYESGKTAVKTLADAGSKWYLKPLRAIGKIANFGCERIYPFIQKGHSGSNFFKKAFYHLKGISGIGRALFAFAVIAPILSKPVVKVVHKIFGKPTNSVLDEGKEETAKDATKNSASHTLTKETLFNPKTLSALGLTAEEVNALQQKGFSNEDIVKVAAYKKQYNEQEKRLSEVENAKPLASNSLLNKPINAERLQGISQSSSATRTYVPSSKCKVPPQQIVIPQQIGAMLNKADIVEKNALAVLNGKH